MALTDNEIIKALECHAHRTERNLNCCDCDYIQHQDCSQRMSCDALDLINRQKAEIEKLELLNASLLESCDGYSKACDTYKAGIERLQNEVELLHSDFTYKLVPKKAKAEGIKECLEWVLSLFPEDKTFTTISRFTIKQKLKEMVGDAE